MIRSPKSLRLQIGIFGRTNVGKSSFLNMIAGQQAAVTSPIPGTTTDVVEKSMELLPVGPVTFLDTGGFNDTSSLGHLRIRETKKILHRADVIILITESGTWGENETAILQAAKNEKTPVIVVINKIDIIPADKEFLALVSSQVPHVMTCSSLQTEQRNTYIDQLKGHLIRTCPKAFLDPPALIGDCLPAGGIALLIVPIDLQAPKGRLILPQVQSIRDALDNDAAVIIAKEREYAYVLSLLNRPPDIVVCDSQVAMKMVADTPQNVKCTTFSILFARYKGDLLELTRGAVAIDRLKPGDRVLVAEACSHHAIEDDIGRVKIPRWLRQYLGSDLTIDVYSGRDYPENLTEYRLVIHCGGCMLTRREMLYRIHSARKAGVPIVNYGICISRLQGVLERTLSPFPAALEILRSEQLALRG